MAPAIAGPPIRALILADREAARARRNAADAHGPLKAG
jgi:hypothetical protein